MKIIPLLVCTMLSLNLSGQNVGIGISNPDRAKLEVIGVAGVGNTSAIFGGDGHGISLQRNWATIGFNQYRNAGTGYGTYIGEGYAATQSLDPSSGLWAFDILPYGYPNTGVAYITRALTINNSGNVGIGNTTANAPLQFINDLRNRKMVMWETANNDHQFYGLGINSGTFRYQVDATGAAHRFYAGTGTNSSNLLMTIQGDKRVLISNSGGGGFLGVNLDAIGHTIGIKQAAGTGLYIQEAASGTNWHLRAQWTAQTSYAVLALDHNGSLVGFFRPSGEYAWGSDNRLKTNIRDIEPTLEKLMKLKPKVYEIKANNPQHEKTIGFIAQDVKSLFPELVVRHENSRLDKKGIEDVLAVSYAGFGVIAIKAIQEQQQQIESQQKQLDDKSKQIEELKQRLDKLEKMNSQKYNRPGS